MKHPQKTRSGRVEKGKDELIDSILDERVINGLSGDDKITHVEKIQAIIRGKIARLQVTNLRSSKELNSFASTIRDNYPKDTNRAVHKILEELGPFKYTDIPNELGSRIMRKMVVLENGSKYEG